MIMTNSAPAVSNSLLVGSISALVLLTVVLILTRHIRNVRKHVNTDSVTGALSSAGFAAAADALFRAQPSAYSVVAMDLQNYSQILQTFGADDCDRVLRHLCRTLKAGLSKSEPVGRIFGGTFCFLMKNCREEDIRVRLARILENANQFNRSSKVPYPLDLRFGICILSHGQSLAQMQEAVMALARDREDAFFRFTKPEYDDRPARKWELARQMESSLKNGDFIVYLQPKIRLGDSRIVGAEALIRWRHPQKGMLTPEMFLPALEEYRQVTSLDLYLFNQVCRALESWTATGRKPCPVSVNLSPATLLEQGCVAQLKTICKRHNVSPEWIEFEMGESYFSAPTETLCDLVRQIHEAGFRCALDNFGRSFIPMHLLRQLDMDTIKLDRSFFTGENNSRRNRFLVDSILKFATRMQISTVAEGIDNVSQVQYLQQAGCEQAQGFYYLKPMPIEEFQNTVYDNGDLRYLAEKTAGKTRQSLGRKIVMFSLTLGEDQLVLSEPFSPLLEGKEKLTDALNFFRYSGLIHENDRTDFFHLLERCCKEEGWVENTLRFFTANGRYEWLEVHMHKERGLVEKDIVISGTLVNMAEVDRWKDKANRDGLTGLYNKAHFEQSATALLERENLHSAAIIFVDIDDFKKVNDTLGHLVGDDVIRCVAKRIFGVFRHTDIVARYGGDEFVIFVDGIGREDLKKRLQQLCDGFRFPYRNDTIEYPVSGSIGAAMFPEGGTRYRELLDHADLALYTAKHRGKNQFVLYEPGMTDPAAKA